MRMLDLAYKDLLQIVRDWRAAVFLVLLPVAFTIMFGFAFGGFGGPEEGDPRLPVGYVDQDGGALSPYLLALLANSSVIRLESQEAGADLGQQVADEELAGAVIVPAGFSQGLTGGQPIPLQVIVDSGSSAGTAIEGEIRAAVLRLSSAVQTAQVSSQTYEQQVGFADSAAKQAYLDDALTRAVAAWGSPPLTVSVSRAGSAAEDMSSAENAFAQSSPGMMAQFAIAGLMGAAAILVLERKSGSLRRLLTTPISRTQILFGHFLAMFVMIFVQLLILALFGQLLLHLDYFGSPLATLLVMITTSLFAASLGLFIGALAKNEDQVVVFTLIPMFVLAGLGGAWVPLEVTPEAVQRIARLTPVAWTMEGFQNIIIRGLGLESVLPAAAVLTAYTLVFFGLAVWRFRFE